MYLTALSKQRRELKKRRTHEACKHRNYAFQKHAAVAFRRTYFRLCSSCAVGHGPRPCFRQHRSSASGCLHRTFPA